MSTIACAQPQDSTAKTQQIEPPTHKEDGEVGQTGTAAVDMNETEAAGFYCGACMQSECLDCAAACYPSVGCYSYAPGPYPCPYPYAYGAYPPHPPAASEEYTDPYLGEYANGQVPYSGAPYFAGCPECTQCAECSYCSYGQPPMYNESACPPPWLAHSEEVSPSIGAVPMQPAAFEHAQEPQPACCAAELPVAVEEEEGASPAGVELTPEQLHSVDPVRYKTRLCTAFQQGKQCEYGERCLFAHGPDDLRFPASNFAALLRAGKLPRHIRKYYTAKFLGEDVEEIPASAS